VTSATLFTLCFSTGDAVNIFAQNSASRGYLTTPEELRVIAEKASRGIQPYADAVSDVLQWAARDWDFSLDEYETCRNSDNPAWIDDRRGTAILYAKALAYHLTGDSSYAQDVQDILERIMTEVRELSRNREQCRLNFSWGTPELVAAADLIEDYWHDNTCTGPISPLASEMTIDTGDCKTLFQNWLAKNPYPIISYAAVDNQSNWGAAATNAIAYIADYLWDRPDILLANRNPPQLNNGSDLLLPPAEAYAYATELMFKRNVGFNVDFHSNWTCDRLDDSSQSPNWAPVKSQITENGIIPEDARRDEFCNIPRYNGEYQNYPQIYLNNNIQQCELMLRRGNSSCYDNIANDDVPEFTFRDPDGDLHTTHLYPGRGSIERAINAIIIDSNTEWRHDSALEVAYRYYSQHGRFNGVSQWFGELDRPAPCTQGICFGTLTHGFAVDEIPSLPPTVPPPGAEYVQ
jgi:hypothetical protein